MKWVSERRFLHFIEDIKKLFAYKNELPTKLSQLENDCNFGGASYEQVSEAVKKYLDENGVESEPIAKIGNVTLLSSNWVGNNSLYSQVVDIDGVTENSQVDLTPSVEQLAIFYEKDLTFVTENAKGVVTVYVIGQKPQNDYTIQVTITEVEYE